MLDCGAPLARTEASPWRPGTTGPHTRAGEGDAYRESLEESRGAAERAGQGVNELLELARLEAGQAALRLAPLRLDLLAEEVAASIRVDGVTLEAGESGALVVDADYGLLRQPIEALPSNAWLGRVTSGSTRRPSRAGPCSILRTMDLGSTKRSCRTCSTVSVVEIRAGRAVSAWRSPGQLSIRTAVGLRSATVLTVAPSCESCFRSARSNSG